MRNGLVFCFSGTHRIVFTEREPVCAGVAVGDAVRKHERDGLGAQLLDAEPSRDAIGQRGRIGVRVGHRAGERAGERDGTCHGDAFAAAVGIADGVCVACGDRLNVTDYVVYGDSAAHAFGGFLVLALVNFDEVRVWCYVGDGFGLGICDGNGDGARNGIGASDADRRRQ